MRNALMLKNALVAGTFALAALAGCAPEEDATGIVRPKAKPTATPMVASTPQTSQDKVGGRIKDRGNTLTTATNPPPPEPTPLPSWTPNAPPSLDPIIVPSGETGTDTSPTADPATPTTDPNADPTAH